MRAPVVDEEQLLCARAMQSWAWRDRVSGRFEARDRKREMLTCI